ncbi:diguanylate cyclase [Frigidibacter mobilis]|uniref:Diguanylate cyclase n=1 Tax=Frigidibacter mobilis TaxID=1335048 RepID=A0A159Z385_9RHOB|nr:diguanylate cyclase [Frigidibacter mobilis]
MRAAAPPAAPPAAPRAAAQETVTLAALAGTGPAPAGIAMPPMTVPDLSQLSPDLLGVLMPMFLWLDPRGRVQAAGPTLRKVCGQALRPGVSLFDMFEITRPQRMTGMADLRAHGHRRLHLALRARPRTGLRGIAVPLGAAAGVDGCGMLLNLSFGLTVSEAVRDHCLTDSDFAPTDLTVEMLYLIEAKSAVMGELQGMNLRLERAHRSAVAAALTDPLTGLANRRALELALEAAVQVGGGPKRRPLRWRIWTLISSSRSMTRSAMPPGTPSLSRWRGSCRPRHASTIWWRASAATNSCCCCAR